MNKNEVTPLKLGKKEPALKDFKDPKTWPDSLRNFITRCFTKSNELNFNAELKAQFQLQLKKIIDKAIEEGKVEQNDWNRQKLPIFDYSFKKLELMCNLDASHQSQVPLKLKNSSLLVQPKLDRKIGQPLPQQQSMSPVSLSSQETPKKISMKIPKVKSGVLRPNAFSPLTQQSLPSVPKVISPKRTIEVESPIASKSLKKQRLERFAKESANIRGASPPVPTAVEPVSDMPLIGTCRNLEKNYLRLTSAPNPELVRPAPVLKKTLKLLRTKYETEKDYNYLKNQLKSLRQDITVQHIKNRFTIKAYEFNSKIAIDFKDLGELNQCQSQLKQLYQMNFNTKHKNKYEFLGYRILYFIVTRDHTEIMSLKLTLLKEEPEAVGNEFIMLALKLWDYTLTNNYHEFFLLVHNLIKLDKDTLDKGEENDEDDEVSMNNLNHTKFYYFIKLLKDFIIEKQILTALSIISKSYKKLSITFLQDELFLSDPDFMREFLEARNLQQFIEGGFFEFSKARQVIHDFTMGSRRVDIEGQI